MADPAPQAAIVDTPLLNRQGRPLGLRHPADLALDLLDELGDPARRRFGLLLLDADLRLPRLAIGEPHVERAIDDQRHAYQPYQREHVLDEKPAAAPQPAVTAPVRSVQRWRLIM